MIFRTLISFALFVLLNGCTYSITMIHSEGSASDLVDQTQTAEPDTTADFKFPDFV